MLPSQRMTLKCGVAGVEEGEHKRRESDLFSVGLKAHGHRMETIDSFCKAT